MQFICLCRRTNDPKLAYIERQLTDMNIASRRSGESFHAPILEVERERFDDAWAFLSSEVELPGGNPMVLDDIPDDHSMFDDFR